MAQSIKVNPADLDKAAQDMGVLLGQYQKQYQSLSTEVDGMGQNWQGADNLAYVAKIKDFSQDFQNMMNDLQAYIDFLNQASKTYKTAQGNVVEAASSLRTKGWA